MMQSVSVSVVCRRLRSLHDFRSVFRTFCSLISLRCYGVASNVSRHACDTISMSAITRSYSLLSASRRLLTSCRTVYSDPVTDAELANRQTASTEQSASDDDDLDVERSNLHTPVLAKEVVSLLAPVKGQVRILL